MLKHGQLELELARLEKHRSNLQAELDKIQSSRAYRLWQDYHLVKRNLRKLIQDPRKIKKLITIFFAGGASAVIRKLQQQREEAEHYHNINIQYHDWLERNYPSSELLDRQQQIASKLVHKPLISILVPTYNTDISLLRECIESVIEQSYSHWELIIVDDCSPNREVREIIKEYANRDKRIKYKFRKKNGHISKASNSALKMATGEWVGLLDHDDFLWPNALFEVSQSLVANPRVDMIYTDEDKIDEIGVHFDPQFKPDWSPMTLLSCNYITHFLVARKALVQKVGGFREGYEGAQDYDLILRLSENTNNIIHIPKILYSWRAWENSTASGVEEVKPYAYIAGEKALNDALRRRKIESFTASRAAERGFYHLRRRDSRNLVSNAKSEQFEFKHNGKIKQNKLEDYPELMDALEIDNLLVNFQDWPKLDWQKPYNGSLFANYRNGLIDIDDRLWLDANKVNKSSIIIRRRKISNKRSIKFASIGYEIK